MTAEIASIPEIAQHQIDTHLDGYLHAGHSLGRSGTVALLTCARGSSDHAAHYLKYLAELRLGLPVCSMGPSIASLYGTRLNLPNMAMIAVSQSGQSEDLCSLLRAAGDADARTLALVNAPDSPLSDAAETTLPIGAGREVAVAATKTFVASLIAAAALVAGWAEDRDLSDALRQLPEALNASLGLDWSAAHDGFTAGGSGLVLSRGPGLPIALEAALKLKETCALHAEAYSSAEVLHGPVALASPGLNVLSFGSRDAARDSILEAERRFSQAGARVFSTDPRTEAVPLGVQAAGHPLLDPICQITSFYGFVERLSVSLGFNPDAPEQLSKVTVTI